MLPNEHTELMRLEANFWKPEWSVPATIWFHISVVRFFKTLTLEQVAEIQERFAIHAHQYFQGHFGAERCRLGIDTDYGLRSWNCPGSATGFDLGHDQWDYAKQENVEWIQYLPHNVDNPIQFFYLVTVACQLRNYAEAHLRAK